MNTQLELSPSRRVSAGGAMHLGRWGGELTVVEGRVWLTRSGDLGDHVISAGQRVRLAMGENAVIESAQTGTAVEVRWNPRRQSLVGSLLADPLRGIAGLMALAARGFGALARIAAAGANRAQGGHEAMGSSIALK